MVAPDARDEHRTLRRRPGSSELLQESQLVDRDAREVAGVHTGEHLVGDHFVRLRELADVTPDIPVFGEPDHLPVRAVEERAALDAAADRYGIFLGRAGRVIVATG